jgi:hypothetical protein
MAQLDGSRLQYMALSDNFWLQYVKHFSNILASIGKNYRLVISKLAAHDA